MHRRQTLQLVAGWVALTVVWIGLGKLMWESDFPHVETPWPHSQDVMKRLMHDVPDDEAALMTNGNARRAYNWPRKG